VVAKVSREASKRRSLHLVIILVCVASLFGPATGFNFVWDDRIFLLGQDAYETFDLRRIFFSLANRVEYLPVRDLSYTLDYTLWGENPFGFHLTNLLLYLLSTACVYLMTLQLMTTLFDEERALPERRAENVALLTTLLFAVHPIHSEPVSFISCRNVLLSGLFFFLSCHFFLKHLGAADGKGQAPYAASLACCALALFSKATAVVLPGVLLLVAAFDARTWREKLPRLAPFVVIAVAATILFKVVATQAGLINPDHVIVFGSRSIATRLAVAAQIPFFYFGKLVLPTGFSALYDTSFANGVGDPKVWLSLLALATAVVLGIRLRRRRPEFAFALGWFLVALFPVLNLFATNPLVADRYAYLSSYSFVFLVSTTLLFALPKIPAIARQFVAAAAIAILAFTAWQQNGVWRDDETLWNDTIDASPKAWKAYYNLGAHYFALEEYEKTFKLLEQLAERRQSDGALRLFQARYALQQGDPLRAIELLEGHAYSQELPHQTSYLLGQAYERSGDLQKAIDSYSDVLNKGGHSTEEAVVIARDRLEGLQAKVSDQLEEWRRAVAANPSDLNQRASLALTLDRAGLHDEALRQYTELSRRGGGNWSLYYNMGNALTKLERYEEAVASYEKSIAMNPKHARTYNHIGIALKKLREYDRAIRAFETAMQLDPNFENAPFNLAALYFRLGDKENATRAFDRVLRSFPQLKSQANPYLEALR
jgi:tetratricopeptide (TPR) repeat protein